MRRVFVAVSLAASSFLSHSQPTLDAAAIASQIEGTLKRARYMEGSCEPATVSGWEGHKTKRCSYQVKDTKTGATKTGLVILLDPTPLQLSKWMVNACAAVRPRQPAKKCVDALFSRIIGQSGGQFPIAGVVYEDLIPRDGVQEAYAFRNGVTVIVSGLKHRDTAPLSSEQLDASISADVISTASKSAPARIIGVTREQYLKANPGSNVDGLNWLSVVAKEYQVAMRGDRNALIEAWLRSAP